LTENITTMTTAKDKITADYLIRNTEIGKLNREIDEIYHSIEQQLIDASNSGHGELYFELPETFETGTMEKKDLQLIVYTDIIERLLRANYVVEGTIYPSGDTTLHITWPHALTEAERRRRIEILSRYCRRAGKASAPRK